MTRAAIVRWLRHRRWAIEDAITDLLDMQRPRPAPPPKPAPPRAPDSPHYVNSTWAGVGFQRADAKDIDALWQQQIFREMAKSKFFEIRY